MLDISKGAKKALQMLKDNGYEAYCVGGCVRDMLMGNKANDFDVTTSASPDEMKEVFSGECVIETGLKHGTLTVLFDKEPIEITTYRIDGEYKDSRHPESVTFSKNLRDDLSRRDFTMNALVYNEKEGVLDLFGGIDDIKNGVIRAIGDPQKRFCEDALRILRAIRFSSTLGFEIEKKTKEAMLKCAHLISNISAERITSELEKLLLGKNVRQVILNHYDILACLIPELGKMKGFDQHTKWHIYDILEHTAVAVESAPKIPHLRLTMLLHDTGKVYSFTRDENGAGHFYGHGEKSAEIAKDFLAKYKYDNFTAKEVYELVKHHDLYTDEDRVLIKKRLNRMGKERFLDLIKVQRADNMAQNPVYTKLEHFDILEEMAEQILNEECFDLSSMKINGKDLIALGIPAGKEIGNILSMLLSEVIEERIPNEKNVLLKRAQEMKNG
ncbi:MAG: HD domain-containing protein [Clostridia bacterium]|nr:HD domain-containing protein [Clostridia bacterium]